MARQIMLTVPEDLYQQAEQAAQATNQKIEEVLTEKLRFNIPIFPIHKNRPLMEREIAAYEAMHAELWQKYSNQYVAIYQGQVVDHDVDIMALVKRKRQQYTDKVVLIRQVLPELPKPLMFRSPRFVRNQE